MLNITKQTKKTKIGTKARMIYHLTSVTMAIIKPTDNNVDKDVEKSCALLVGMLNDSAIMENSTVVSHKINNRGTI